MDTPKTLQQATRYFSDEQVCIDTIAKIRWPNGPICPACDGTEHYFLKTQKRWKCKKCAKQFSVKLGTIFEDSPISLDKWLVALWRKGDTPVEAYSSCDSTRQGKPNIL